MAPLSQRWKYVLVLGTGMVGALLFTELQVGGILLARNHQTSMVEAPLDSLAVKEKMAAATSAVMSTSAAAVHFRFVATAM